MGLVIIFFKSGFSCNQNLVEVERDLKQQQPCKNTVLMLKHRIWQPAFASSVAVGALGEFVGGLHPAHEITGADGAQRRCWNGWVSSGRADVRKIGESCCMFLSQNCPNSLLFLSAVTAEFQKRFFCSRI